MNPWSMSARSCLNRSLNIKIETAFRVPRPVGENVCIGVLATSPPSVFPNIYSYVNAAAVLLSLI